MFQTTSFLCYHYATMKILQETFGESYMSKTQVYEWYKAFKEGQLDLSCFGRSSTFKNYSNINKIKILVLENHCMSLRDSAQDMIIYIFLSPFMYVMTKILGGKHASTRFVSKDFHFFLRCVRVFGQKRNKCHRPSIVMVCSGSV